MLSSERSLAGISRGRLGWVRRRGKTEFYFLSLSEGKKAVVRVCLEEFEDIREQSSRIVIVKVDDSEIYFPRRTFFCVVRTDFSYPLIPLDSLIRRRMASAIEKVHEFYGPEFAYLYSVKFVAIHLSHDISRDEEVFSKGLSTHFSCCAKSK